MKNLNETKMKSDTRIFKYDTKDGAKRYKAKFGRRIFGKTVSFEKQGFKTQVEAKRWADEALRVANLTKGTAKNLTVQEYYDRWTTRHLDNGDWEPDTFASYSGIFKRHILPRYSNVKLNDLNRDEFQEYLSSLYTIERPFSRGVKIGYASKTIGTIKRYFSIMLNEAVDDELIPLNRIKRCRVKDTDKHKRNVQITEEKYAEAIVAANEILSPMALAIYYLTLLALRHGEILGLRPESIFLDHIHLDLARTAAAPEGTTLKNQRSYRDVPITPKVHKILQAGIEESRQIYMECGKQLKKDSFIFVNRDARPQGITTMNHYFDLVSDKIGFHVYPHMMRHAFATFNLPTAADPVDVQNIMGHSSFEMTQYYDTGSKKREKEVINDFSAFH